MVAISRASITVRASGPPRARANSSECRTSSTRDPASLEATPSTPRPTATPASRRSLARAMPEPSRALEDGQCATEVPVAASLAMSASSRWTAWASQTSGPSQSDLLGVVDRAAAELLQAERVLVLRLAQVRVHPDLVGAGQRGRLAQQVAGDGEGRARRQADPQHRAGRGVVVAVDGVLAGGEDGVDLLDHVVRRQAAVALPQVHGAAGRVEAEPDGAGRVDRGAEHVAAGVREDVVMVGRRRAAGLGQPAEGADGRRPRGVLVDAAPDRVERGEPAEQRRVDRQAAGRPLVEVVVDVDEAGRQHAVAAVDPAGALGPAGAGPEPTWVMTPCSTTTWPRSCRVPAGSTVTTVHPSMTTERVLIQDLPRQGRRADVHRAAVRGRMPVQSSGWALAAPAARRTKAACLFWPDGCRFRQGL